MVMRVFWVAASVLFSCLASAQPDSRRAFIIGRWKVDTLNSEIPLTVKPERVEMTQNAMKRMWFEFRKDGSLVMSVDPQAKVHWRLSGDKIAVKIKNVKDSFIAVKRKERRLHYNFNVDAGQVRLVLVKA